MRNTNLHIDATKYDIRVLWTGTKEEHVSADAGVVEGYPLDPPDEFSGWFLEAVGVETTKEADRYWTLWTREKTAAKKARKSKQKAAPPEPKAPKEKKPRERKRRDKPPEDPTVLDSATKPETN